MCRRILIAAMLLLPAPGMAQSFADAFQDLAPAREPAEAQALEGSWALRLGGAIIFRFDLTEDGGEWSGAWSRPGSFASDGNNFGSLKGPTETLRSSAGREIGEWVELTFPDERVGAVPDVFRFNPLGPDRAEMIYVGTGLAPYTLERVGESALLGPWEDGTIYGRDGARPAAGAAPQTRPRAAEADSEVQGPPQGPVFEGR